MENQHAPLPPTRYRWPWFVLAAVILFLLLAFLWVSNIVRRTREQRFYPSTNELQINQPPH